MQEYLIEEIVKALQDGDLVALPTETVYGLAANALNLQAVKKIFDVKGRPLIDPLIVHIHDINQAEQLAHLPPLAYKLAEKFWPGPLTLVLPKKTVVPDIVTAGLPNIAIRIPKHPIFQKLLATSKLPLAAPSANPFGYLSPTKAQHVKKTLGHKIKYIVDGGPCTIGLESTILSLINPQKPEILRPGPIDAHDLQSVLGLEPTYPTKISQKGAQLAPGLLKSHYSPQTPLKPFSSEKLPQLLNPLGKYAIIFLQRPHQAPQAPSTEIFWLSEDGNLNEVAKNLFSLLAHLDDQNFDSIFIELPPNKGLGLAINDRLKRAFH